MNIWRRFVFFGAVLMCCLGAYAQRPTKVSTQDGFIEIGIESYLTGGGDPETSVATATGRATFNLGPVTFVTPTVNISSLTSTSGQISSIVIPLQTPVVFTDAFGPGTKVVLNAGTITYNQLRQELSTTSSIDTTLGVTDSSGKKVTLSTKSITLTKSPDSVVIFTKGCQLGTTGSSDVLISDGVRFDASVVDLSITTSKTANTWKIAADRIIAKVQPPDLPIVGNTPLVVTATKLQLESNGKVSFGTATLSGEARFELSDLPGFVLTIRQASVVSLPNGRLTLSNVVANLRLPESVRDSNNSPIELRDLACDWQEGPIISLGSEKLTGVSIKSSGVTIKVQSAFFDGSSTRSSVLAAAGTPPATAQWQGLFMRQITATLPQSIGSVTVTSPSLLIDENGLTGEIASSNLNANVQLSGFTSILRSVSISLAQGEMRSSKITGTLTIPSDPVISLDIAGSLTRSGQTLVQLSSKSVFDLPIGCSLTKLRGSISNRGGVLAVYASGNLKITSQSVPPEFKGAEVGIEDIGFTSSGGLVLPSDAVLTLSKPLLINFNPVTLEIRRIGIESNGKRVTSISLTGGGKLSRSIPDLPISGEIDFQGLTLSLDDSGSPQVTVGGLAVSGRIDGVGDLLGELKRQPGSTGLGGSSFLRIEALGNVAVGLKFRIEPDSNAWFVGGTFSVSADKAIPIVIPATPSPVTVAKLYGVSGGFGLNFARKQNSSGRILDPMTELVVAPGQGFAQIGVLMGDQITGNLWIGEINLTVALNPVVIELAGNVSILDPAVPGFVQSEAEWNAKDRTASAALSLNFGEPSLRLTGEADIYLPSRSLNILEAHGSVNVLFSPKESYIRVGWPIDPDSAVSVKLLTVASPTIKVTGTAGFEVNLTKNTVSFELDAEGSISLPDIPGFGNLLLSGGLSLSGLNLNGKTFEGQIQASIEMTVELFDIVADIDAELVGTIGKRTFRLDGDCEFSAGWMQGSFPIHVEVSK